MSSFLTSFVTNLRATKMATSTSSYFVFIYEKVKGRISISEVKWHGQSILPIYVSGKVAWSKKTIIHACD